MQAKSQEKFPDSEIERAMDTSPQGWKGMDGSRGAGSPGRAKDGAESRLAGQGARRREPPGPSPRELRGDISAGWSLRPPRVPSQPEQQVRGSTDRSAGDTGTTGGCMVWMLPPPRQPFHDPGQR